MRIGYCRGDTECDRLKGTPWARPAAICSETGDGERHSSDLAQAWALAKRHVILQRMLGPENLAAVRSGDEDAFGALSSTHTRW